MLERFTTSWSQSCSLIAVVPLTSTMLVILGKSPYSQVINCSVVLLLVVRLVYWGLPAPGGPAFLWQHPYYYIHHGHANHPLSPRSETDHSRVRAGKGKSIWHPSPLRVFIRFCVCLYLYIFYVPRVCMCLMFVKYLNHVPAVVRVVCSKKTRSKSRVDRKSEDRMLRMFRHAWISVCWFNMKLLPTKIVWYDDHDYKSKLLMFITVDKWWGRGRCGPVLWVGLYLGHPKNGPCTKPQGKMDTW